MKPIKILLTCRNRFAITKKAIEALQKFTRRKYYLYVSDNLSSDNLQKRFHYFSELLDKEIISEYSYRTKDSTYNAFSKAVSINMFGLHTLQEVEKDRYEFLLMMDNDMIVCEPSWDDIIANAWQKVKTVNANSIMVITQSPGGIQRRTNIDLDGLPCIVGSHSGSGFWTVQESFFRDVPLLDLKRLVGKGNADDIAYWPLIDNASFRLSGMRARYVLGIKKVFVQHAGRIVGSICNNLRENKPIDTEFFNEIEKKFDSQTLQETIDECKKAECNIW